MPTEPADLIPWGVGTINQNARPYRLYQDYHDGEHRLVFASEKFKNAFGTLFRAFALNMCPSVVEAITDRMEVEAWNGQGAEDAQVVYDEIGLDLVFPQVHEEALTKGDAVVICELDSTGTPRAYLQDAENIAIRYDPNQPGSLDLAVKVWQMAPEGESRDRRKWRLNVYTLAGRTRFVTRDAVTQLPEKSSAWIEWDEDGPAFSAHPVPGMMPVFHYGNRARVGRLGRSELVDVIPVQDWLNKTVADLLVGMEYVALPQRWATGLEVEEDPDNPGQPLGPEPFKGGLARTWTNPNDAGAFGQFEAADLNGFLSVIKEAKQSVAQVTGTPTHYLALEGEFPSGESLKTAEARLVKRVQRRQRAFGARHADAMTYLLAMNNLTAGPDLEPVWESAETRNEKSEAETQEIKQRIGVSKPQSLREMGYTDAEIEQMEAEKQASFDAYAGASLAAFDRAAPVSPAQGAVIGSMTNGSAE